MKEEDNVHFPAIKRVTWVKNTVGNQTCIFRNLTETRQNKSSYWGFMIIIL